MLLVVKGKHLLLSAFYLRKIEFTKIQDRDQLSLPYVLWKNDIKPAIMPGKANGLWENEILPQCTTSTHLRNV